MISCQVIRILIGGDFLHHGCQLWYTEINQLLEISKKLEEELSTPWTNQDSLGESLVNWRIMSQAFIHKLEELEQSSPTFLENYKNARVVVSRLLPFGESVVEQLEVCVGTTSDSLGQILEFYKQQQEILRELRGMMNDSKLSFLLVEEIHKVLTLVSSSTTVSTLNECISQTVDPLRSKCSRFLEGQTLYFNDFDLYLSDYKKLCEIACVEPRAMPSDIQNIDFLKEQITILAKSTTAALEQGSIRRSFNQLMVETGFQLVGFREKTLENGTSFIEDLYLYRSGVAVSVLYRWDKKIILVLGGISKENREPTVEESRGIREYMFAFQENIAYIKNKMLRKGIIFDDDLFHTFSMEDAVLLNQNEFQCPTELEVFGNYSEKKNLLCYEKGGLRDE